MPEEPAAPPLVTAADISRLAGVTRATVSNWRKRHPDFPVPIGGTDTSPAYDVRAVTEWLAANDRLPEPNPIEGLRSALRLVPPGAVADVLPLVLAASRLHGAALDELLGLQGDAFDQRTAALVAERAPEVPATSTSSRTASAAPNCATPSSAVYGPAKPMNCSPRWTTPSRKARVRAGSTPPRRRWPH